MRRGGLFPSANLQAIAGMWYVFLLVVVLAGPLIVWCLRKTPLRPRDQGEPRWHLHVIFACWWTYFVILNYRTRTELRQMLPEKVQPLSPWDITFWVIIAGVLWLQAESAFRKQRPQYSIRSLLILTLVVAPIVQCVPLLRPQSHPLRGFCLLHVGLPNSFCSESARVHESQGQRC
jgi:hypothetical protein